jgi:hypothetical protein
MGPAFGRVAQLKLMVEMAIARALKGYVLSRQNDLFQVRIMPLPDLPFRMKPESHEDRV